MIRIENISKTFNDKKILNDISFNISKGESIAIIGQSGVGKSVLLKHINGLLRPDFGNIYIDNSSINNISFKELQQVRKKWQWFFNLEHYLIL